MFNLPLVLSYPSIDPVLVHFGPFAIRWYALAYIAGLVLGWRYMIGMVTAPRLWASGAAGGPPASPAQLDDLLIWITLGVVLGGRSGYILFYGLVYSPEYYLDNPLHIFAVWEGGMSFHGGCLGVVVAVILFCRAKALDVFGVGDLLAAATPLGLFFGRIANFINGELFGRPSHMPWAMIFPNGGPEPRHPSQLYEASLEGLALFMVLRYLTHHTKALSRPGLTAGVFLAGYGIARTFCEFFRSPENPIGETGLTMGMLLSLPLWLAAAWLIRRAYRPRFTA